MGYTEQQAVAAPGVSTADLAAAVQNATYNYQADTQVTDAYAINPSPAITAYADGQEFRFKANTANTGAASLNVNTKGAITIKKNHDQDLATGDIEAGSICVVIYDATQVVFQLVSTGAINPATAYEPASADFTGKVSAASDTAAGKVELATIAETTTGTDATRAVTPDGLAGSSIFGVKAAQIIIVADGTDVDTTSGVGYFKIPAALNGMNLIRAQAFVTTAGTTNATTIQVRNLTKYSANDALSSAISIASGATAGTAGTVNTSYDDVATDDNIKIYVTAQSTTKPKGLYVVLEYQLP